MKAKKADGKGQNVLTDHSKIKPKKNLSTLLDRAIARAIKTSSQRADK